jgi:hypothetical protein
MATYTPANVTFSAAQEAGFDMVLFKENARRAALSPPQSALTKQQYLDGLIQGLPADYLRQFRNDFRDRCGVAMLTATPATLQAVATDLSVDPNPYD